MRTGESSSLSKGLPSDSALHDPTGKPREAGSRSRGGKCCTSTFSRRMVHTSGDSLFLKDSSFRRLPYAAIVCGLSFVMSSMSNTSNDFESNGLAEFRNRDANETPVEDVLLLTPRGGIKTC